MITRIHLDPLFNPHGPLICLVACQLDRRSTYEKFRSGGVIAPQMGTKNHYGIEHCMTCLIGLTNQVTTPSVVYAPRRTVIGGQLNERRDLPEIFEEGRGRSRSRDP